MYNKKNKIKKIENFSVMTTCKMVLYNDISVCVCVGGDHYPFNFKLKNNTCKLCFFFFLFAKFKISENCLSTI